VIKKEGLGWWQWKNWATAMPSEGRPTCLVWQVPHPGDAVPEVGTLEDPDEGTPAHMRKKRNETVSVRCQGGKMSFWNCFKWWNIILWESCTCIISYSYKSGPTLHICYAMWIKHLSESYNREVGL